MEKSPQDSKPNPNPIPDPLRGDFSGEMFSWHHISEGYLDFKATQANFIGEYLSKGWKYQRMKFGSYW